MKIKKEVKKWSIKELILILIPVLIIILIFTAIDFYIHSLNQDYGVPSYYFTNKIIYGTIIGLIAFLLVRRKSVLVKSITLSLVVSVLLQFRYYFIEHYSLEFVLEFLVIHFIILLPVSLIVFLLREKYFYRL